MAEEKKLKMFPVNDSSLKQKSKIHYKDIKAIVADILKNEKLRIWILDLYYLAFDAELFSQMKLIPSDNNKKFVVYFFRLIDKYNDDYLGVYQPFSGEFYMLGSDSFIRLYDFHGKDVEFPLGYCKYPIGNRSDLFEVSQCSRCYKVATHWFSDNKTLVAYQDRCTTKIMHSTEEINPKDDFQCREVVSMEIKHYKKMYITN